MHTGDSTFCHLSACLAHVPLHMVFSSVYGRCAAEQPSLLLLFRLPTTTVVYYKKTERMLSNRHARMSSVLIMLGRDKVVMEELENMISILLSTTDIFWKLGRVLASNVWKDFMLRLSGPVTYCSVPHIALYSAVVRMVLIVVVLLACAQAKYMRALVLAVCSLLLTHNSYFRLDLPLVQSVA